jgi:hypothetical protein
MDEGRGEGSTGGTGAAAYVHEGGEVSACGSVVAEDGCVEFGVVASAVLGVGGALVFGVGPECPFGTWTGWEVEADMACAGNLITENCSL